MAEKERAAMRRKQTQRTHLHSAEGVNTASGVPTVSAAAIATSAITSATTTSRSNPPAIETQSTTAPTKSKSPTTRSRTSTNGGQPKPALVSTPTRRSSTPIRGSTPTRSSTPTRRLTLSSTVEPAKGTKSRPAKETSSKSTEPAKKIESNEPTSKPKTTEMNDAEDEKKATEFATETRRNRASIFSTVTATSNTTPISRRPSPISGKSPSASTQPKEVTPTTKKASPSTEAKRTQFLTLGVSPDGRLIATKIKEPPKVSKALTLEEQVAREIDLLPADVTKRFGEVAWAKILHYPYWPSCILDPRKLPRIYQLEAIKKIKTHFFLYFYGSHNFGAAPFNSIVLWDDDSQPYRSGYPRKSGQGSKIRILKTAIAEAEIDMEFSIEERLGWLMEPTPSAGEATPSNFIEATVINPASNGATSKAPSKNVITSKSKRKSISSAPTNLPNGPAPHEGESAISSARRTRASTSSSREKEDSVASAVIDRAARSALRKSKANAQAADSRLQENAKKKTINPTSGDTEVNELSARPTGQALRESEASQSSCPTIRATRSRSRENETIDSGSVSRENEASKCSALNTSAADSALREIKKALSSASSTQSVSSTAGETKSSGPNTRTSSRGNKTSKHIALSTQATVAARREIVTSKSSGFIDQAESPALGKNENAVPSVPNTRQTRSVSRGNQRPSEISTQGAAKENPIIIPPSPVVVYPALSSEAAAATVKAFFSKKRLSADPTVVQKSPPKRARNAKPPRNIGDLLSPVSPRKNFSVHSERQQEPPRRSEQSAGLENQSHARKQIHHCSSLEPPAFNTNSSQPNTSTPGSTASVQPPVEIADNHRSIVATIPAVESQERDPVVRTNAILVDEQQPHTGPPPRSSSPQNQRMTQHVSQNQEVILPSSRAIARKQPANSVSQEIIAADRSISPAPQVRERGSLPDLVIFNKDGTLLDFYSMWGGWIETQAWKVSAMSKLPVREQIFEAVGYDWTTRIMKGTSIFSTCPKNDIPNAMLSVLITAGMRQAEAQRLLREFCVAPDAVANCSARGNIGSVFRSIKRMGIKIAVVTTDNRKPTMISLHTLGVAHLVDAVSCGDDGLATAPSPDQVWDLCRQLNVDTYNTILVGDTPSDMQQGRQAACPLLVGVYGGASSIEELAPEADFLIPSVDKLTKILFQFCK